MREPHIFEETGDFAVVWKPPRMHCAPLKPGEGGTLLDWYAAVFPPVRDLAGRREGEGGLVHRLDFETRGLVLFAKKQCALDFFLACQDRGEFVKEYGALCVKAGVFGRLPGFPPPLIPDVSAVPFTIESFFRPYGPARKQVRPTLAKDRNRRKTAGDRGDHYRTEVIMFHAPLSSQGLNSGYSFTLRIKRGFRHQIRCHLAWAGYPILNDPIYGVPTKPAPEGTDAFLALESRALVFPDPGGGTKRIYRYC
jgi:23S rRNA pseudouridine1911/1915/1917 synthase